MDPDIEEANQGDCDEADDVADGPDEDGERIHESEPAKGSVVDGEVDRVVAGDQKPDGEPRRRFSGVAGCRPILRENMLADVAVVVLPEIRIEKDVLREDDEPGQPEAVDEKVSPQDHREGCR